MRIEGWATRESNLDYFGARYYANTMGRWMSPDNPTDDTVPAPIPFAELSDPQTLNMYSYVRNDPLNHVDPDGHLYVICSPEGNGNQRCTTVSDQAYYNATQGNNPGIGLPAYGQSGNITCGGQVCGTATHFDEGGVNDLSTGQLVGIAGGKALSELFGAVAGRVAAMLGRTATEAAAGTVEKVAAKVLVSGTKAAVRDAVEQGAVSAAQKAAVKRALARAAASNNITIEQLGDGSIRVVTDVAGRAGGNATYEKIIDAAGNTVADSVVQKAYDASGKLVHVDPK